MVNNDDTRELISAYSEAWVSLDAYDKDTLPTQGSTPSSVSLTAEQLLDALQEFKAALVSAGSAVELFGNERAPGSVEGIVGNVMQAFDGKPVYPTVEEQAAHLFYFLVKDHPFVDGNKRSGAYAFIWFLHRAAILDRALIPAPALTALTLFIAESNADQKEKVVRLVLQLLKK